MNRTDLALEAQEELNQAQQGQPMEGVALHTKQAGDICITQVQVQTPQAAQKLGKPMGNYITLEMAQLLRSRAQAPQRAGEQLAGELGRIMHLHGGQSVLVVGLGNAAVTPDSIGPRALEHLLITRHLIRTFPDTFGSLRPCCAIAPGVLGTTGLESAEMVKGILATCKAEQMIVIDALAACEEKRLCSTVQIADTGIVPGSGIGNSRAAFNQESLGIPVYAIGVPTVIRADVLRADGTEHQGSNLIVTPSDIDARVRLMAKIVAAGINRTLFSNLTEEEIANFVES